MSGVRKGDEFKVLAEAIDQADWADARYAKIADLLVTVAMDLNKVLPDILSLSPAFPKPNSKMDAYCHRLRSLALSQGQLLEALKALTLDAE